MALTVNVLPVGLSADSYRSKQPDKVEDTLKLIRIYKNDYEFEYGKSVIGSDKNISWNRTDDIDSSFNSDFSSTMSSISDKPSKIKEHNEVNEFKNQEVISSYEPSSITYDSDDNRDDVLSDDDNLLSILKNSSASGLGIEDALKRIGDIENINKDFRATSLKLFSQVLNELNVLTTVLADTLPALTASLSVVPKIAKTLEKSVQVTIESNKVRDFNSWDGNAVLAEQRDVLKTISSSTSSLVEKSAERNSHLKKQGDLAEFELTEEITDSQGNKSTPAFARALHHAEKAEETKNMNNLEITDDDFSIFDLFEDFNPFEEVAKLITQTEEKNDGL